MRYLSIKNWDDLQHYKDRNPPWIKLHRSILDDYELSCLQDASKLHLILIWVLASQLNNRIPDDPEWVARKINATTKVNLKDLIDKGFLLVVEDASKPLAECSPETEGETDIEKEKAQARKSEPDKPEPQKHRVTIDELSVSHISDWLAKKRSQGKYLQHDEVFILEYFKNYCESNKKKYDSYPAALKNAFEWDTCQPKQTGGNHGQPKSQIERALEATARARAAREQRSAISS